MNWIGAMLLGFSAYWIGVGLSRQEGEKTKALESLIAFFDYMKRRMTAEKKTLNEIFSTFDDPYLKNKGFTQALCGSRCSLGDLWQNACRMLPLSDLAKKELCFFGDELGKLSLEDQLARIEICKKALLNELEVLRTSLPKKQKSIKTVCGLCGVLAAILLL